MFKSTFYFRDRDRRMLGNELHSRGFRKMLKRAIFNAPLVGEKQYVATTCRTALEYFDSGENEKAAKPGIID